MNFRRLEMSFSDLITTTDSPYAFVEDILNLYDVPSYNRTLSISPITSRLLTKPRTITALRPFNRGTVFVGIRTGLFLHVERSVKEEKERV